MNFKIVLFYAGLCLCSQSWSEQPKTMPVNDVRDERNTLTAIIGATVYTDAGTVLNNATIQLRNGNIISIKQNQPPSPGSLIKDYSGLTIYPGFIHLDSSTGLPEPDKKPAYTWGMKEQINSKKSGAYNANQAIRASYDAADHYHTDPANNKQLRAAGFTAAITYSKDGIMRGTSTLVSLADQADQLNILTPQATSHYSFNKGSSSQDYPISLMGSAALIRQTLMDAQWYKKQNTMTDLDLKAINENAPLPHFMSARNWQEVLLAKKIGKEFDIQFVVRTKGDEFHDINAVKSTNQTLIVPLNKPDTPSVKDSYDAWHIDLKDLKNWEIAPFNPALLEKNNIEFVLIPADSDNDYKKFIKDLRVAVEHGLSKRQALAALTSIPAKILKRSDIGHLGKNTRADFIVTSGDLFDKDTKILETWVNGNKYTINKQPLLANGKYQINTSGTSYQIELANKKGKTTLKAVNKEDKNNYKIAIDGHFVQITINTGTDNRTLFGIYQGQAITPLNNSASWSLEKVMGDQAATKTNEVKNIPEIPHPFSAYGYAKPQRYNAILFQNATVWTNEKDGILENTDVMIKNGKIHEIGKNLTANDNTHTIDATGKHLTAGIIDEHSHIALLSVNDIAVNSSMVRMQDAVNSHSVNIYRNLAGGVTTSQLLHGSANPIGGQSALVKLRWGTTPQGMLIEGSDGFIKFALGENVKRSSSSQSIRYPQTRMGVEQVYRDEFTRALNYRKSQKQYQNLSKKQKSLVDAPRKDLAMEALLEILDNKRHISCHSYVQSEINMLMHVAEDFDFKINTFTHILEGYKVADKMHEHGAGGSTFSDWWAYKWEVNYAIPYNAALMHNAGVVTAINSDSSEMSRRLNQEAAKTIKYGGLSEQEALKLVTLNPAKLLHLDDRMGSIRIGKDADVVLWSNHPLSIYTKAEKTLVDGIIYFDRMQQDNIENKIADERKRLIQLLTEDKSKGKTPFKSIPEPSYECDHIDNNTLSDLATSGAQ